jgi:ribose transport system permease protein
MSAKLDVTSTPTPPEEPQRNGVASVLLHLLANHGLLLFGVALVLIFAVLLPGTFAGMQTVRAILGNNTTVALLAMAEMLVIACGNYDLSIAYSIGLMHIIAMSLIAWVGVPWPVAVVVTILAGGLVGWINGALVEFFKIDSFIATLGVGTILYGVGTFVTNGTQVVGVVPRPFALINDGRLLGLPLPTFIVAIVAVLAWLTLEHLPVGRQLYAIGANRRAAELTGVNSRRLVMGSFIVGGLIVGVPAARLRRRAPRRHHRAPRARQCRRDDHRRTGAGRRHRRSPAARQFLFCRTDFPGRGAHHLGGPRRLRSSSQENLRRN